MNVGFLSFRIPGEWVLPIFATGSLGHGAVHGEGCFRAAKIQWLLFGAEFQKPNG